MRKKSETKRQEILDIAANTFREFGFERTSMSQICSRVGGSKATLYSYFKSKEELFYEAILVGEMKNFDVVTESLDNTSSNFVKSLYTFGVSFLTFLCMPIVNENRKLVIAESRKSNLGVIVYENVIAKNQKAIAEFLDKAVQTKQMRVANTNIAAKHLISLIKSEVEDELLFGILKEIGSEQVKAMVKRAIDIFMAAYKI
ncbi:MAG: TetR/AcrR family transcriptional regulator [Campylobacterales bacterium]